MKIFCRCHDKMASHITRSACILLLSCVILSIRADDPPFPALSEIFIEFYETQVTVTNTDQEIVALAEEYYDNSGPRGVMKLVAVGNKYYVMYDFDTDQIIEVTGNTCQVNDTDTSTYDYTPVFFGWLNKDPLRIGPSAPLWLANNMRTSVRYVQGEFTVRDIKCEKWTLQVNTNSTNVEYSYFFADKSWTTPYGYEKLRVPIRIAVTGNTSIDVAGGQAEPINQYTDFAYFKPSITNWGVFQPPEGIGCLSLKETLSLPKIPKVFQFSAEVYDLVKASEHADSDVEYMQVWYDYDRQIARQDKYTSSFSSSELYDFNTGVTYSNMNDQSCHIKALRDSFFETYFTHAAVGHMKTPEETLNLDGDFYYMGQKLIRGIWCDVFESVEYDTQYGDTELDKFVVTVYFSKENYRVSVSGEEESRIPVFYQLRGYDSSNKILVNLQYNIFAFDDVVWPEMYESFQLARCFPTMNDKTYFVMLMNVLPKLAAIMENQDGLAMVLLREQIIKHAKISDMRLAMLQADYKTSGVFVTGLILDRPPALKQFWKEFEGDTNPKDNHLSVIVEADTKEKCAMACIKDEKITCLGFYWCGAACYVKSKDILEDVDPSEREWNLGICETWIRAEKNSLGTQPYLADAIKNLENAVLNQSIVITLDVDQEAKSVIPVHDIVIGDGPYTGQKNIDTPYDKVMDFAKLDTEFETTQEVEYVTTLNDCFKACKDAESIDCSSFSYCPDANNKQCFLSSTLITNKDQGSKETKPDKNCYVYSIKYLDMYTAYPGRSVLIGGEDSLKSIKSAEECAKNCRTATKFACRGFEYCRSEKTCVLHSKHVLDLKPGQIIDQKKLPCTHYAAKFTADYFDMGYTLIEDNSNTRSELSLEECAKSCSEEFKSKCKSFNYCPASAPYMTDSSCSLSSSLLTDEVKTTTKDKCHHYEKKGNVDDWAKVKTQGVQVSGYTSKGFTGLVIAMLALGLVLGAIGFVVYSYYKSKTHGEGMTVRFMKSDI